MKLKIKNKIFIRIKYLHLRKFLITLTLLLNFIFSLNFDRV